MKNINGEVALNGTVPSYPQYLEAAAAAQRVAGVKHVHNHLVVELPDGDYRDDAQLTTAANNALKWDVTVPLGVEATARDGNLTLTGTVHFGSQRTAAELAVSGLTGVRNVKNEIAIDFDADAGDVTAAGAGRAGPQRADRRRQRRPGRRQRQHRNAHRHVRTWAEHDAVVGRRLDGQRRLRGHRRPHHHRLTVPDALSDSTP